MVASGGEPVSSQGGPNERWGQCDRNSENCQHVYKVGE